MKKTLIALVSLVSFSAFANVDGTYEIVARPAKLNLVQAAEWADQTAAVNTELVTLTIRTDSESGVQSVDLEPEVVSRGMEIRAGKLGTPLLFEAKDSTGKLRKIVIPETSDGAEVEVFYNEECDADYFLQGTIQLRGAARVTVK